jgi:hypothetical protein
MVLMHEIFDHGMFFFFLLSVLENKNSGPYLFFQRQFWSSVKVCIHRLFKRLQLLFNFIYFGNSFIFFNSIALYLSMYTKSCTLQANFIPTVHSSLIFPQEKMNSEFQRKAQATQQIA